MNDGISLLRLAGQAERTVMIQDRDCGDENDAGPIVVAGNILLEKDEVLAAAASGTLKALLQAKAKNIEASFLHTSITEIEKRGWAIVEYAKNTTPMK